MSGVDLETRHAPVLFDVPLGSATRPSWRGRCHLIALVTLAPVLAWLLVSADGTQARVGLLAYAVGLCSMLAVSATYHRWVHTIRWRARWRRLDHATIFAAIAGTCTPLCLAMLGTGGAIAMLMVIWTAAVVGATIKLTGWTRGDSVATAMYIANGWMGCLLVPAFVRRGDWLAMALLVSGGIAYTAGALGFARHWPTLRPAVFSYHEVWHVWTVAAAGLHLAAVWIIVV